MSENKSLTTPAFYVYDNPCLAQLYSMVAADVYARFLRSCGGRVFLSSGSDEHGESVIRAARAQGLRPMDLADRVVERFLSAWKRFDIELDDFVRTSEPRHAKVVQQLFARMRDAGDVYLGDYEGLRCPTCAFSPAELDEPLLRCPMDGAKLEPFREKRYFFRLSRYADALMRLLDENEDFIQPRIRQDEVRGLLDAGLKDLTVSRLGLDWGAPVPGDEEHSIYVWVDALASYLHSVPWEEGKALGDGGDFWPADLQFIGRDILKQHAIHWPALLMSAGLPLPRRIFAHGLWNSGRSLDPHALADAYGVDGVRYFLLREIPFGLDGEFSHHLLIDRLNGDLADELSGLFQRILGFVETYAGGRVPEVDAWGPDEQDLEKEARVLLSSFTGQMEKLSFHKALETIWKWLRRVHRYLDRSAPWALGDRQRTERDRKLRCLLESMRWSACLLSIFLPETARAMFRQLGLPEQTGCELEHMQSLKGLEAGLVLKREAPLFYTIEAERRVSLLREFERDRGAKAARDCFPSVAINDLDRLDLRVGRVLAVKPAERSGQWLLEVDLAEAQARRVLVCGENQPGLEGRRVLVLANAEGFTGTGMLLTAGEHEVAGFSEQAIVGSAVRPIGGSDE